MVDIKHPFKTHNQGFYLDLCNFSADIGMSHLKANRRDKIEVL